MNDYNLVDLDLEFIRDNIDSVDVLSTDGHRDEKKYHNISIENLWTNQDTG